MKPGNLVIRHLHRHFVMQRRIQTLSRHIASLLRKENSRIGLDVGSGSGEVSYNVMQHMESIRIQGLDILLRPEPLIDTISFDGKSIPGHDKSYDFVLLVDVLHHIVDPAPLLTECARVSKKFIILKDHLCNTAFDRTSLQIMDWFGNTGHGVALPYAYLSSRQWSDLFERCNLHPCHSAMDLKLYPFPVNLLFDRNLHFLTLLEIVR